MEQVIKVLVVDDERYSRDELKYLLGKFSSVEVVGEAGSGEEGVMKAIQLQPDVVFLDVEMPKLNGMEVAKSLVKLKRVPLLVFATAYPQFAAEAFRYEAIDYLVKPYDIEQLQETIKRIERTLYIPNNIEQTKHAGKLAIESKGEIHYIEPKDILYMYRDEKVSRIMTKRREYEVKTPLKELESRLIPYSFFRIHKSYVVNLQGVSRLSPWFNGAYQLEMEGVTEKLYVSRNYVKALRAILEL
ncbi:LytR/AlgR family response regulator transcription factor [Bacillus fonticola]|uniref:LytR/AlgR family response regulator transcription factor n=1 Tax=Bacillus fonticola TaxID=2728853 RepID=UPI001472D2D0|nr:LytTR family DNA-binding domain-containing protein [Bacillus fonticola]